MPERSTAGRVPAPVATPPLPTHPDGDVEVVRGWSDGRLLFLHGRQGEGADARVVTDFFALDGAGGVAQRWRVGTALRGPNPSGRTQLDGRVEPSDPGQTEANKALVATMLEDCLFPGSLPENIERYFSEDYRQHNPDVGDGLAVVRRLSQGAERPLVYDEIVLLVGQGDFVATLCRARWEGAPLAQVDIMRVEQGKVVEHWDCVQPAPEGGVAPLFRAPPPAPADAPAPPR